jgi:hypothetical protein
MSASSMPFTFEPSTASPPGPDQAARVEDPAKTLAPRRDA